MTAVAILDVETTGMRARVDRVIEVGVVVVRGGRIEETFTELMDPGIPLPGFITSLTGITPSMLSGKPSPEQVMPRLQTFLGDLPCVAHNAAFDRRFIAAEMARAAQLTERSFFCTVLLARRLVPEAGHYNLEAVTRFLDIRMPNGMRHHRAMGDAVLTAGLWIRLMGILQDWLQGRDPSAELVRRICRTPKAQITPKRVAAWGMDGERPNCEPIAERRAFGRQPTDGA